MAYDTLEVLSVGEAVTLATALRFAIEKYKGMQADAFGVVDWSQDLRNAEAMLERFEGCEAR